MKWLRIWLISDVVKDNEPVIKTFKISVLNFIELENYNLNIKFKIF